MRAYSSARLERFPDKEEVAGSSPARPTTGRPRRTAMKKLLAVVLAALGVLWAVARRDDGTAATRTTAYIRVAVTTLLTCWQSVDVNPAVPPEARAEQEDFSVWPSWA